MTEMTPLARKLWDARNYAGGSHVKAWNNVAKVAEAELASVAESATARPIRLPTVEEVREAIIAAERDGGWIEHTVARAVLDLIASRVPAWVPVNVDDIRPGMRVRWVRGNSDTEGSFTVRDIADDRFYFEDGHVSRRMSYTWYIDPRTVPADPEDPRIKRAHAIIPALQRVKNVPLGGDLLPAALEAIDAIDALEADR